MSDQDASWHTGPKHSRLGIASFVISIAAVGVFIWAIVIAWIHPVGVDPYAPAVIWLGNVVMLAFALGVVAIALGVVGLFQKEKKKALVILALVFSSPVIAVLVLLVVVGMSAIYV